MAAASQAGWNKEKELPQAAAVALANADDTQPPPPPPPRGNGWSCSSTEDGSLREVPSWDLRQGATATRATSAAELRAADTGTFQDQHESPQYDHG
jgi:hypothetical protein